MLIGNAANNIGPDSPSLLGLRGISHVLGNLLALEGIEIDSGCHRGIRSQRRQFIGVLIEVHDHGNFVPIGVSLHDRHLLEVTLNRRALHGLSRDVSHLFSRLVECTFRASAAGMVAILIGRDRVKILRNFGGRGGLRRIQEFVDCIFIKTFIGQNLVGTSNAFPGYIWTLPS